MKRKKRSLEITEEFKKKLLSKVFKDGYAKTPDNVFHEKFCGYCGEFPMEVEFYHSTVYVKRMDKPHKSSINNKVMTEFAHEIFETDVLEIDELYTMDFEGAEVKFDFDYKCISMVFFEKEKEDVA